MINNAFLKIHFIIQHLFIQFFNVQSTIIHLYHPVKIRRIVIFAPFFNWLGCYKNFDAGFIYKRDRLNIDNLQSNAWWSIIVKILVLLQNLSIIKTYNSHGYHKILKRLKIEIKYGHMWFIVRYIYIFHKNCQLWLLYILFVNLLWSLIFFLYWKIFISSYFIN